jgi:hypothetical protein
VGEVPLLHSRGWLLSFKVKFLALLANVKFNDENGSSKPCFNLIYDIVKWTVYYKKFMAVIVAYCDKLDCLPLPFTSIAEDLITIRQQLRV